MNGGRGWGKELHHLKVSILLTFSLSLSPLSMPRFPYMQNWDGNKGQAQSGGGYNELLFVKCSEHCLAHNKCSFCPPPYLYSNHYIRSQRDWAFGRRIILHVNTSITHYWRDFGVNGANWHPSFLCYLSPTFRSELSFPQAQCLSFIYCKPQITYQVSLPGELVS